MLDVKIQPPENPVEVIADSTRAATFILHDEDHTIGNLLCDVLSDHPLVDYVGYSIVHPTQPKIQVRIQTREGLTASDALKEGLMMIQQYSRRMKEMYKATIPVPQ